MLRDNSVPSSILRFHRDTSHGPLSRDAAAELSASLEQQPQQRQGGSLATEVGARETNTSYFGSD